MKMQPTFLCFLAVFSTRVHEVFGAKILALLTLASPSHHIWNRELMIALASRGHQVTVISNDIDKELVANLTYIHIKGSYDYIRTQMVYEELTGDGVLYKMQMLTECFYALCDYQLSTEGVKHLLSYPDGKIFDLIITEAEYTQCFWPFISKFGSPPLVGMNGAGIPRRANYITGTPKNPAYTPDYMLPFSDKMNFMQRMESFLVEILSYWLWNFEYFPTLQKTANRHFGYPVPVLQNYERNISVVLSNVVFGYDAPRPVTPNVIPVGGMHLKPPRPLEQKLQQFLDDAKDGAIFFSLGSNLKSSLLPAHVQQAFLEVFAGLPQRILWKFESDSLQHVPNNVMLGKWLPQRDILGHKNVKLFITHNGLMSSQEAVYFGVPTLGIPFFMDQQANMVRARVHGTGIGIPYKSLNKEIILRSIKQVLTNNSYAENAQRLSAIFRDQMEHPLDRAVFWVEYVLRHGGAPHLRTVAVDMPLYRYLLLDVLAALLAVLAVAVLLLRAVVRWIWRCLQALTKDKTKIKTN